MNVAIAHGKLAAREALATALRSRGLQVYSVPDVEGVLAATAQARVVLTLVEPRLLARESVDLRAQIRAKAGYDTALYVTTNTLEESDREAVARHGAELLARAFDDTRGLADWIRDQVESRVAAGALDEGLKPGEHWSGEGKVIVGGAVLGAKGSGTGATILVVEDEPSFRLFLCDALGDRGYTVYAANDGLAALAFLKTEGADLVISDINMPGMDGFALKQSIDLWKKAATPFIMMTADGRRDNAEDASAMGVVFILGKPIRNLDALYAIVAEALSGRR